MMVFTATGQDAYTGTEGCGLPCVAKRFSENRSNRPTMQKSFLAGTYSLQTRIQNPSAVLNF
jgi:hypothetical protein